MSLLPPVADLATDYTDQAPAEADSYEQLAGYYRRLGHDEQARRVLLAKQRQRRRQRPWRGWLPDALAGYGYAPGRALLLLAGAFVTGWLVFSARHPVPVGPGPHPAFNAALYTLDVLIPAPALGQASDFDPQGRGCSSGRAAHPGLAARHYRHRGDHPLVQQKLTHPRGLTGRCPQRWICENPSAAVGLTASTPIASRRARSPRFPRPAVTSRVSKALLTSRS